METREKLDFASQKGRRIFIDLSNIVYRFWKSGKKAAKTDEGIKKTADSHAEHGEGLAHEDHGAGEKMQRAREINQSI